MKEQQLLSWYSEQALPFLTQHAVERINTFDGDYRRLQRLLSDQSVVTVCFLGNSGIGKSTLLNALAAGGDQVLPSGGIGPLTAQATEVRFNDRPYFKVRYHPRTHLWRLGFALESFLGRRPPEQAEDFSQSPLRKGHSRF